jgi:hypothetical protein
VHTLGRTPAQSAFSRSAPPTACSLAWPHTARGSRLHLPPWLPRALHPRAARPQRRAPPALPSACRHLPPSVPPATHAPALPPAARGRSPEPAPHRPAATLARALRRGPRPLCAPPAARAPCAVLPHAVAPLLARQLARRPASPRPSRRFWARHLRAPGCYRARRSGFRAPHQRAPAPGPSAEPRRPLTRSGSPLAAPCSSASAARARPLASARPSLLRLPPSRLDPCCLS